LWAGCGLVPHVFRRSGCQATYCFHFISLRVSAFSPPRSQITTNISSEPPSYRPASTPGFESTMWPWGSDPFARSEPESAPHLDTRCVHALPLPVPIDCIPISFHPNMNILCSLAFLSTFPLASRSGTLSKPVHLLAQAQISERLRSSPETRFPAKSLS
jgi:hypothetical protein